MAFQAPSQYRRQGGGSLFDAPRRSTANDSITALGDPDHSIGRAGTQEQFPAAASQKRIQGNQVQAQKVANLMGQVGVSVPEEVQHLMQTGLPAEQGNAFTNIIKHVLGPYRAINLGVQDIFAGREEQNGFKSPGPKDYWNAFMGKDIEVMLETGHNPMSGSETLALMGWEEVDMSTTAPNSAERWAQVPEKMFRGLVTFTYESLIDPTTYVSFGASGLGRKIMGETGELAASRVVKEAVEGEASTGLHRRFKGKYDDYFQRYYDEAIEQVDEDAVDLMDDLTKKNFFDDITTTARDRASASTLKDARDEIVTPLVSRDFGNEAIKEWKDFMPNYAQGGVRFSLPFLGKKGLTHGWTVPGTQGLGRNLIGDRVRNIVGKLQEKSPAFAGLSKVMSDFSKNMDLEKALTRAVAKGDLTGGEYIMFRHALANDHAHGVIAQATGRLQYESDYIHDLAFETLFEGGDALARKEFTDAVNRGVFQYINTGGGKLSIAGQVIDQSSEMYRAVQGFGDYARETMDTLWKTLKQVAPDGNWDDIAENYIPYLLKKENANLIRELAKGGKAVEEALETMTKGKRGAGAFYLQALLGGASNGGMAEAALGSTARSMQRASGFAPVSQMTDQSVVLLFPKEELTTSALARRLGETAANMEPAYIDLVQLNDLIEPVLDELVTKHGVHLGKNATLRPFSEDPFEAIMRYVDDMDSTIRMRGLLQVLEENGFIVKNKRIANVQETFANIAAKLENGKVVERLDEFIAQQQAVIKRETGRTFGEMSDEVEDLVLDSHEDVVELSPKGATNKTVRAVAQRGRMELGRTEGKRVTRHIMPPINYKSPTVRRKYAMEQALAAKNLPDGEVLFSYYNPEQNRWYATKQEYWKSLSDHAKNILGGPDFRERSAEGKGLLALMSLDNQLNGSFSYLGRTEHGHAMQRAALEFSQANGLRGLKMQHTDNDVWDVVLKDTVFTLSDAGAYHSRKSNHFRTLRAGGDYDEQDMTLIQRVTNRVKKELRGTNGTYNPDVVPKSLSDVDWDASYMRDAQGGLFIRDEDGTWKFIEKTAEDSTHFDAAARYRARKAILESGGLADIGKYTPENSVSFLDEAYREGNAIYVDFTNVDIRLRHAFDQDIPEHVKDATRWMGHKRKVNRINYSSIDEQATEGINDIMRNVDNFDEVELYNIAEEQFRQALRNNEAPLMRRQAINSFRQTYGDAFVAQQLQWTKEILDAETAAYHMMQDLNRIQQMIRPGHGPEHLTDDIVFGMPEPEALEFLVGRIRKYGKQLGIDPDTFEIAYSRGPGAFDKSGRAFVDPSIFNVGGEALENKTVQADINSWLEQLGGHMMSIYTPDGIAQLKTMNHNVTKWWKAMVTLPRATFHIRNAVGGVWNNQIIGVGASDYLTVRNGAMSIRKAMRNNVPFDEAIARLPQAQREVFEAAWESGVLDLSFSSAEFRNLTSKHRTTMEKTLGALNVGNPDNFALTRMGAYFMESIEDFLRMSAFAAWYDPKNPASRHVAKEMALAAHFDYKNLTKWETNVKKVIPFFVWQRRNLPLQLQNMVERPGLMTRYAHFMNAMDDNFSDVEQDEYGRNRWMSGSAIGTDIVLNEDTPFWSRIMFDPDIPIKDVYDVMQGDNVGQFLGNGIEYMLSSLGPTYSFVQDMVEQKEYGSVNAPAGLNVVMAQLARTGLFDVTTDGDVEIPYQFRSMYYMLAPWQRELEDMGVLPQTDPERRLDVGMGEGEMGGVPGLMDGQLGGTLARAGLTLGKGLGFQAQTPRDTAAPAWEGQQQLNDIVNKLFKTSPEFKELWENQ